MSGEGESEEKDTGANGESEAASGQPASAPAKAEVDPVAEAKAEAARMKDQWMRTAADFDNFRKRSRREIEDTRKAGKEDLLKEFLPVFDNLERAIASAQRATDVKAVAEGLTMVLRQYTDTLARGGITKVPTVGEQFDPTHHEAIQQVETDEHPPGTVVAEVQPGYAQGDRLIRAAMVVVAKPKSKSESEGKAEGSGSDDAKASS
ncbi:MAG: nucleotide exchange factor GrpE [Labilithrix sp.]|nr:nucleotide exchange factor GrpE [Labilithrix sp.]MCW5810000.1 nucleotide exchange factor GrpE [Labilithrix sp.]